MAKTKQAEPAGTVATRRALEAERQAAKTEAALELAKQTDASRKATAKFLSTKPTDTRNLDRP